jgi:hypothetical protein
VRIPKDTPTVDLRVGVRRSGEPVHEEVPVTPVGSRRFRLLASPTLALGAAAGDEIEVDEQGVSIVRRGGNVAVHVEATEKLDDGELVRQVNELGGVLDGRAAIERVFERFVADNEAASWSYGNVYDSAGEPLNWWLDVQTAGR